MSGAVLSVSGIRKRYGGVVALRDVSLDFPAGTLTAIVRIRRRLAELRPGPAGRLPILVGGLGERMTMDVCARLADAWNGWGTPTEIARLNGVLDDHCHRAGRDPGEVERTVAVFEPASDATYDDLVAAGAEHLILVRSGRDYRIDELHMLLAWRDLRSNP